MHKGLSLQQILQMDNRITNLSHIIYNNGSYDFVALYTATPKDTPAAKPSHADIAAAAANKGNILIPPIIKSQNKAI